jgi:DNA integrity scanning protein DisA with diadenylate cyclase activity
MEKYKEILNESIFSVYNHDEIDYIILVEGMSDLDSNELLKHKVTVLDKQVMEKNIFFMENDDKLDLTFKLRRILSEAINHGFIKKNSIVTFLFDTSMSDEYTLGMLVLHVSRILYRIARFNLTEFMKTEQVLEKVLEICDEIKKEGREGKMIGGLFLIGDIEELSPFCCQLVLNPFFGYSDNMKDIINNDLNETIKEYAQLDGAFIISNDGIIQSCGTYIDVDTKDVKKYMGWGTKHLAASAITQKTKAIAVLISESGNKIKVFKEGKLILKY